jgi:hypothetical protein
MLIRNEYKDPLVTDLYAMIKAERANEKPRGYVGASSIGDNCEKKLWYQLRQPEKSEHAEAELILAANDGHRSEDLMAAYLRKIPGVDLITHGSDGKQLGFTDLDGQYAGHADGIITGIPLAPKTAHIWEHKAKNDKFYNTLTKLKLKRDIKDVLRAWDYIYYCQAVSYMEYFDIKRHYTTVVLAGTRKIQTIRTNCNPPLAKQLKEKAKRIITYTSAPYGISENPEFHTCKMCFFRNHCHGLASN